MLADWWDDSTLAERTAILELPELRQAGFRPDAPYDDTLRDALVRLLMQSGSDLVVFPLAFVGDPAVIDLARAANARVVTHEWMFRRAARSATNS